MLLSKLSLPIPFLFYHTYKCGGSSLRRALSPYCSKRTICLQLLNQSFLVLAKKNLFSNPILHYHPYLLDVKQQLGLSFDEYYKFTFVRHPLSLQLSLYTYMLKNWRHFEHSKYSNLSFSDYLLKRVNSIKLISGFHLDKDNTPLIDCYYHLENLSHEISNLSSFLNIPLLKVPFSNVSRDKNATYELKRSVYDSFVESYIDDYRYFGYNTDKIPPGISLV